MPWKIFGVPFDPLDNPEKVELQQAYLLALKQNILPADHPLDPYDLILSRLPAEFLASRVQPIGRLPIPSWLTPRPLPKDSQLLTTENFTRFLDSGGCEKVILDVENFILSNVLPDFPLMVGIDHCLTGGALRALADHVGPEQYSLLLLDSHFDAIPLAIRTQANATAPPSPLPYRGIASYEKPLSSEYYCCGTFLNYLFQEKTILPKNTILAGVTDHPSCHGPSPLNEAQERYKEAYERFQRMGITFIPGGDNEPSLIRELEEVLKNITTPWLYLSVDADIGARNAVYAVRFLDRKGLSQNTIEQIFDVIAGQIKRGAFQLAGMDIMEINIHLSGICLQDGRRDQTAELFAGMIQKLI